MIKSKLSPVYFSRRCHDNSNDHGMSTFQDSTMEMAMNHFLSFYGTVLDYYGADAADKTFMVDKIVFKVLEDPDDGYRSYLGTMDYTNDHRDRAKSIFFKNPIAQVKIMPFDHDPGHDREDQRPGELIVDYFGRQATNGYKIVDVIDGHVWLEIGTDYTDDYYPYFVFRHQPKKIR